MAQELPKRLFSNLKVLFSSLRCTFAFVFYIFVLRPYCNVQLKIYIDNFAIEINKTIIIIIITDFFGEGD